MKLPVLHEDQTQAIHDWCAYVLTQPREKALALAQPLYDVMARLRPPELAAVGQVLQYIVRGERPTDVLPERSPAQASRR